MKKILFFALIAALTSTCFGQSSSQLKNNFSIISRFINPTGNEFLSPALIGSNNGNSSQDFASLADSSHQSNFDTVANAFKLVQRSYFSYDPGGQLIRKLKKSPDKSGNWRNYSLDTITYRGSLVQNAVSKLWDSQLNSWKNINKYEYSYDSLNELISLQISLWNSGTADWIPNELHTFSYNELKLQITDMKQVRNSINQLWETDSRITNSYVGEQLVGNLFENWDAGTSDWIKTSFVTYTYSAGNISEALVQKYDRITYTWVNQSKDGFTYNGSGQMESQNSQLWETDHWVNSIQISKSYTGNDLVNILTKQWQPATNAWRNYQNIDNYYSQHEVFGIRENPVQAILVQNPVRKGSAIKVTGLKDNLTYQLLLSDCSGKNIMTKSLSSDELLSIPANIAAGIYFLNASLPGKPGLLQKILVIN